MMVTQSNECKIIPMRKDEIIIARTYIQNVFEGAGGDACLIGCSYNLDLITQPIIAKICSLSASIINIFPIEVKEYYYSEQLSIVEFILELKGLSGKVYVSTCEEVLDCYFNELNDILNDLSNFLEKINSENKTISRFEMPFG